MVSHADLADALCHRVLIFSCWLQSVFQISVDAPANVTALSNTHPVGSTSFGVLGSRLDFAPSPNMSTYLVAICVGDIAPLQAGGP